MSKTGGRVVAVVCVTFALGAALAACGGDDQTASPPHPTAATATTATTDTTGTTAAGPGTPAAAGATPPIGPACAEVPSTGSGSFAARATQPVAAGASHDPELATLVAALRAADLDDSLDATPDVTVFAPTNAAFGAMPKRTLDSLLADPSGRLTNVLRYHVVPGRITPEQLAGPHVTLEGESLTVAGSGGAYTINGQAKIVCGPVPAANATVYMIDAVLTPASIGVGG
jgi:uncharacterized surface protein with fasciclin (FAS1) repeats